MDDEFSVTDQDQLDLFDDEPGRPFDELIMAGWDPSDHGDPETDPDDEDAWWASLPADLRAEIEARQPLPPVRRGASPFAAVGGAAAFGYGGFCDTMLPGAGLGEMLAAAGSDGFAGLSDEVLSGMLRGWQRQVSHGQAALGQVVAEISRRRVEQSGRPGWSAIAEHFVDELGVELTLGSRSAERLRDVATGLQRLREVNSSLLSGLIDWPRACVFVDELAVLGDAAAQEIAERLADKAAGWTTGQLRAALARAVLAADPDAAERRKQRARKDTRVELWHEPSGNAALAGRELPTAAALAADAQLTADADWLRSNGAAGTLAELRAMAYLARLSGRELTALLPQTSPGAADGSRERGGSGEGRGSGEGGGSGAGPDGSKRGGSPDGSSGGSGSPRGGSGASGTGEASRAGSVHVTMPLSTLAGLSESPGEVAGYGPVDAMTSRELAGLLSRDPATRWCLTVTGPDGTAVAHACARCGPATAAPGQLTEPGQLRERGEPVIRWAAGLLERLVVLESGTCRHAREAAGYVPPTRLRHLVMVRQRRCSFPGCRRPARSCDLDHTIPFENGGITCECNLAPLCRRHHRAKQVPGWHLTQDQPGVMTWRLPSGRVHETTGDPY